MISQDLSKEDIMSELEGITIEYASLLKEAELADDLFAWRIQSKNKLLELKERLQRLRVPTCRLLRAVDRIEANSQAAVLMSAIDSVLRGIPQD